MPLILRLALFLAVAIVPLSPPTSASIPCQDGGRKLSPFDGLRWQGNAPEVQVAGTWYGPIAIHGVLVADILEYCEKRWPGQREKRFGEDLVEAVEAMGTTLPVRVDLVLEQVEDGKRVELDGVEMTAEKRTAIRDGARARRPQPPRYPSMLDREAARRDLVEFRARLEDQFAYLRWKGVDLAAGLDRIEGEFEEKVSSEVLADSLHRLLMTFGDGHASVRSPHGERAESYPPVLLVPAEGGVVALLADRSGYLEARRPFVVEIDGRTLDEWESLLSPWIAAGSPQLVRTRTLRALREIQLWRTRLGVPASDVVTYELASRADAKRGSKATVELQGRRPIYGPWPRSESGLLAGNLGYLRLEQMDDDLVPDLHRAMGEFKETRGLVVDVRGNGGGSRGLLLALGGYLVGPEEAPRVVNIAAYRTSSRFDDDHLVARFMYTADHEHWSASQRRAIESGSKVFEPEWQPGEGFSAWHYLVLDRTGHADEYFYDRPVVVLCDADGFSATDIFLGALSGHPRVTLLGKASSGGSARTQSFTLPSSGIEVRCASMASFRPDGRLYDGRGIEVDLEVNAAAEDFLEGDEDHPLDEAVRFLRKR